MRGKDGEVRAFHNICRHRGNKLVWNDYPREETSGHLPPVHLQVPRLALRPRRRLTFVQQEAEFFDLDKADYGLVPVQLRGVGGVHLREPRPRQHHVGRATTSASSAPASRATRSAR